MGGKVVQLVQGREKVLEAVAGRDAAAFAGFPQIQVIDLDAAMDRGSNGELVGYLAQRATSGLAAAFERRRAAEFIAQGASASSSALPRSRPRVNADFLQELAGRHRRRDESRSLSTAKTATSSSKAGTGIDQLDRHRSNRRARAVLLRLSLHLCRQRRHDAGHRSRVV